MSSRRLGASRSSRKRSAIFPGYNVRVVLVIQTPAQLREVYGIHNAETMLKSLAARIVFAPKDFADAREISDELGFTTVPSKIDSRSPSGRRSIGAGSVRAARRQRAAPGAAPAAGGQGARPEEAIVFYEGLRPIRCRKIRYFADRRFRKRLLPPPAVPLPPGRRPRSSHLSARASERGARQTTCAGTPECARAGAAERRTS